MAKTVTDATFEDEVLKSEQPVLVDFWAEWCPPCRMMSPIVDEIGEELGDRLKVVKLDTDNNPQTAMRYGIVSIPTFNVYRDGELIASIIGGRPKKKFKKEIERALG
ncbi:MAG TPA: thioredoxin [Actinomycetaceae bacterium]|nr:thioredoxin [Actinomycetaceae bacterium]